MALRLPWVQHCSFHDLLCVVSERLPQLLHPLDELDARVAVFKEARCFSFSSFYSD